MKDITPREFFGRLITPGARFPLQGQWELTYRCNLRCVMCYTECFDKPEYLKQELTFAELSRIARELVEAGVLFLTLTGGEVLAHPHFRELYRDLVLQGVKVTVFTNGTLISEDIADFFSSYRPESVEISVHGLGEAFDKITGIRGSFDRCLRGVARLREREIPVTLKTLGMTLNQSEIFKIKAFAESFHGVKWFLGEEVRPELNGSEAPLQYALTQKDFGAIASGDKAMLAEHEKITKSLETYANTDAGDRCNSTHKFHIDPYGGLQLCSANREKTYDLRNGSFREGFYKALANFPCHNKASVSPPLQMIES